MQRSWSARSKRNMQGLHPDLLAVLDKALRLTPYDFVVTEGLRSEARQKQLLASGASKTLNSRHLTGHAFDIAVIDSSGISWDFALYKANAQVILAVASDLGVELEWGGNWRSPKDGPHFQLAWKAYPKDSWQSKLKAPEPKSVAQSRTLRGAGTAALGQLLQEGTKAVAELSATLPENSDILIFVKMLGLALTLGGIAYVIAARLDDWKAGHR